MRKLLSLSDLYDFYVSQNQNVKFNSQTSDSAIVVHIEEQPLVFKKSEDDDLVLKTDLRFCHTDLNVNKTFISKETMEVALPTVYNMPILGYIWTDDNGVAKFAGHEFYEDENGEMVYEEVPIGTVPESSELKFVEEKNGKTYLEGTGLIWKTYSKASEILEREKDLSVSIEIIVDELSYSAEEQSLILEKIRFTGVTILQEDPNTGKEIKPGMEGAQISIENFSAKNNSVFEKEELKQFIQASIAEALDNINSQRKEENNQMNHFEELLQRYEKTVEDITFEYEGLTDEELDAKFAEAFEAKEETPDSENETEPKSDAEANRVEMSVKLGENTTTFAKSLSDVIYALTELVNATYVEDGTFYDCSVYDGGTAKTRYVIMQDMFTGKAYKQSYTIKDGVYTLKNTREEVFAEWCTASEREQLDAMRSNYAAMSVELDKAKEKISKFEAEPQKMDVLNAEAYADIKESEGYVELLKDHFDLSVEDLTAKLDGILLDYAKQGKINFAAKDKPGESKVGAKIFPLFANGKGGRYGTLFSK